MNSNVYLLSALGEFWPLSLGESVIGRRSDNTIVIDRESISPQHVRITCTNDRVWITDLNSIHGTLINSKRLPPNSPSPLHEGDQIQLGQHTILTIHGVPAPPARTPPVEPPPPQPQVRATPQPPPPREGPGFQEPVVQPEVLFEQTPIQPPARRRQQVGHPKSPTSKDPDTAFILEFVGGLLGFLGIGHMYMGQTNAGAIRLIGYWVLLFIMWSFFFTFSSLTGGLGLCLFFIPLLIQGGICFYSANQLKKAHLGLKRNV